MKIIQIIILVLVAGLSSTYARENVVSNMKLAQLVDSIVAPNVFTPNEDGKNDFFEVTTGTQQDPVSVKVYTRAGVLVFSMEAKICKWDGRSLSGEKMADGVYFYFAEIRGASPKITKSGFVHLFR